MRNPCALLRRFCFGLVLLASASQAVYAQNSATKDDPDGIKAFVNSVAEVIYKAAWPTATYRSVSINFRGIQFVQNGVDVPIRLEGISAFDHDSLWLELVMQFRDGKYQNFVLGRNNAILMQPFQTTAALVAITAELAKDYAAQQSQAAAPPSQPEPTPPTRTVDDSAPALTPAPASDAPTEPQEQWGDGFCILNSTASDMTIQYRLGNGAWNSLKIATSQQMKVWWPSSRFTISDASPQVNILYSEGDTSGSNTHLYAIDRKLAPLPLDCNQVKRYTLDFDGSSTILHVQP